MRRVGAGFSIIETIIAGSILSLLMVSLFMLYTMGANAWMKSDTDAELLGQAQGFVMRVAREAERSSVFSVSLNTPVPDGICFLSPQDSNGNFQFDPYTKRPRWQKYVLYYRDSTQGEIRTLEQSVVGTPAELSPLELPDPTLRTGLTPHLVGGQPILAGSEALEFAIHPAPLERNGMNERLEIVLTLAKDVRGQTGPRDLEVRHFTRFRN